MTPRPRSGVCRIPDGSKPDTSGYVGRSAAGALFFHAILALTIITMVVSGGCISRLSDTGPVNPAGGGPGATLLNQQSHWSPAEGCYWTVTYQVFNPGNSTSAACMIRVDLVNTRNLAVRDSKTVYVSPLPAGEAMPVTVQLDGECISDYAAKATLVPAG